MKDEKINQKSKKISKVCANKSKITVYFGKKDNDI